MKHIPISLRWFLILLAALLLLTACERPAPRPDDVEIPETEQPAPPVEFPPIESPEESEPEELPPPESEEPEPETPPEGETTAVPPEESLAPITEERRHTVQARETLFRISIMYGVSVEEIAAANRITNVNRLDVGQVLIIPVPGSVVIGDPPPVGEERRHVVQPGENLYRIGLRYGFTVNQLAEYNNIANPNRIDVGQTIRIPPGN